MCLSLLVFTQLFFEVARSQPAKPARKQNLTRNSQSRSCILGSLKSQLRTAYRHIITLTSSLKCPNKIASENAENCRCRQPHCRLMPPLRGASANISISLISPETKVIGLHFCRWYSDFCGVLRKTHLFCNRVRIGRLRSSRSLILTTIERAYATSC